jgi:hypothetical protein
MDGLVSDMTSHKCRCDPDIKDLLKLMKANHTIFAVTYQVGPRKMVNVVNLKKLIHHPIQQPWLGPFHRHHEHCQWLGYSQCHKPQFRWLNIRFTTRSTIMNRWLFINSLVGGLEHEFYFSIYWEFHHPNWLSYFSEGFKPPTSSG